MNSLPPPPTRQVAVIDNGTGFTQMGWAGNPVPTYDIPTVIADHVDSKSNVQVSQMQYDQMDFFIGDEVSKYSQTHNITYPISSGTVSDWGLMEKFWHRSIFDYLRCDPDETIFVLTEPPMNPPQNREAIAEIFFETFNAKALHIGVQAVLALYSNFYINCSDPTKMDLTGTVLDSGDGVTHVIPVSSGFVIGSCIKHIPLAGRDITKFIGDAFKDRGEKLPIQDLGRVSREVKDKYGYICDGDLVKEFNKYDKRMKSGKPSSMFKKYEFQSVVDGKQYTIDVGYQRFMGPEMFFHPEFIDAQYRDPIDKVIDNAIQGSPIDARRGLYANIILSGGSTMFEGFEPRLQRELNNRVNQRLDIYRKLSQAEPTPIPCQVYENPYKRFSVWQGGSFLGSQNNFEQMCHSRENYFEYGPSIARRNPMTMG